MDSVYRRAMDGLSFTDEEKRQLVEALSAAIEGSLEEERRQVPHSAPFAASSPKHTVRRAVIAALVAATLVATVAFAASSHVSVEDFLGFRFGNVPEDAGLTEALGSRVGVSDSHDGYTLTVDSVIGDRNNVCAVCTLARDDGAPIVNALKDANGSSSLSLRFGSARLWIGDPGQSEGIGYGGCFFDMDPGDATVQFLITASSEEGYSDAVLSGGRARLVARCLVNSSGLLGTSVISDAEWVINFTVNCEDTSVEFPAEARIEKDGLIASVNRLIVSPIGLKLECSVESAAAPDGQDARQRAERVAGVADVAWLLGAESQIMLVMEDGTMLASMLNDASAVAGDDGVVHWTIECEFDRIIDMDSISEIKIGDMRVLAP